MQTEPPHSVINGQPGNCLPVDDRGLAYGDGLFETIAFLDNYLCQWHKHYDRLKYGCDRLGIICPSEATLLKDIHLLPATVGASIIKVIITAGASVGGYRRTGQDNAVHRVITRKAWEGPVLKAGGLKVRICNTRLSQQPLLAGMKHLNRLEQVMARAEWSDTAIDDGLLLNQQQHVIEGISSNIFLKKAGQLYTPDLSQSGVAGTVRSLLLDLAAAHSRPVITRPLTLQNIHQAHALYLCNSLIGIQPVCEVIGHVRYQQKYWHDPLITLAHQQAFSRSEIVDAA